MGINQHKGSHENVTRGPLGLRSHYWCKVLRMRTLYLNLKSEGGLLEERGAHAKVMATCWFWLCTPILGWYKQLKENICCCKKDTHWETRPNRSASLGYMDVCQHGHTKNSLPKEEMSPGKFKPENSKSWCFYSLHLRAAQGRDSCFNQSVTYPGGNISI